MNVPRICVVGAGWLSTNRIYPYLATAGAHLVGVCDIDNEKAVRNANRFGGSAYSDLKTMLATEKPDGVMICVGPRQHAELARIVMQHGIPVYTEKPPASTAAEALETARVSQASGVLCTTAFKKRYNNAYSRAHEWIKSFAEHDLYSISFDYASGHCANTDERTSFLLDFSIHILDLSQFLFGDVERVFAFSKGLDAYAISLKYSCGAIGTININDGRSFSVPTEEVEISIRGGNFMTIHNSSCWRITQDGQPTEWREPPTFVSAGDSGNETGHLAEIVDFLAAIREGRSTRSNIYESYKTMVLYEAVKESAETQQPATLNFEAL